MVSRLLSALGQNGSTGPHPTIHTPAARGDAQAAVPDASPFGPLAGATPTSRSVGVYVHVPFCARRCEYCSFNTAAVTDRGVVERFLAALEGEIRMLGGVAWARDLRVETIFLGGGTPSLLTGPEMAALLEALRATLAVDGDAEITVECNPESVTREKLTAYRAAGVNRISLGVQSLDDAILPAIGRLHTAEQARSAYDAARGAGFSNVSVDLMYGLPRLTGPTWRATLDAAFAWAPEHLSAYGLTLDPGSVWGSTGVTELPDEDAVVAQYWTLVERAAAHGYAHYEISNYARPGHRSLHNQIYWRRGEYLAFGPGAAGFVGDVRYVNVKPVSRYGELLDEGRLPIDTHERLDDRQALGESLILGLRLSDGVDRSLLDARTANDAHLIRRVADWRERGLLVEEGTRLRLSDAGFLLSDTLFVDLL